MLDQAKKAAFAEVDQKVFQAMLNPLSDLDIAFLHAMAQDDSTTKVASLEKRLNLTHGTIQTYRRRLLDAGIVSSPRRGDLSFTIPGISDYLRRQTVV